MRVLMITPEVDPQARKGFIVTWIGELAVRADKLYVITLDYDKETVLPENVTVYSLADRTTKLTKYLYFSQILFNLLRKKAIDIVFCHMSVIFTMMVAPWVKPLRIPIVQWYTHGTVSWQLRIATCLANKVVTASRESFRLSSNKVIVAGHGIDTERFRPSLSQTETRDKKLVLSVGRISPRKDYGTLIKAMDILVNGKDRGDIELIIVGGPPLISQEKYYADLKRKVNKLELDKHVRFVGAVPYTDVIGYYQQCDLMVTGSQTGSVDKAVLEAMSCEKPVLVCNEAFKDVLGEHAETLMFRQEDSGDLARQIESVLDMGKDEFDKLCRSMRKIVVDQHNIDNLMDRLVQIFADTVSAKSRIHWYKGRET